MVKKLTGWRYAAFMGGFLSLIVGALWPIAISPMYNSDKYNFMPLSVMEGPPIKELTCSTFIKTAQVVYTWNLHNFSLLPKTVFTVPFILEDHSLKPEWKIRMDKTPNPNDASNVMITIGFSLEYPTEICACFDVYITDQAGLLRLKICAESATKEFSQNARYATIYIGRKHEILSKYVFDNTLHLYCKITVADNALQTLEADLPLRNPGSCCGVGVKFNALRKQKKGTDCTFIFNENSVELAAHKLILSQKSTVFAALFADKMIEGENHLVKINDFDPVMFELLLDYIYTGEFTAKDYNTTCRLMKAADNYGVNGLRSACVDVLISTLSLESAVPSLVWAHLHSIPILKIKAMRFIHHNLSQVSKNGSWTFLKENYPALLTELCFAM